VATVRAFQGFSSLVAADREGPNAFSDPDTPSVTDTSTTLDWEEPD
jgi:hypothetical protein